jgi:hypothetical protein
MAVTIKQSRKPSWAVACSKVIRIKVSCKSDRGISPEMLCDALITDR